MNKHLIASLCGLSLTLLPAVSNAYEPYMGPYFSFNGGLAMAVDADATEPGLPGGFTIESDAGFAGTVAMGFRVNPNIRFEAEFGYQQNDVDRMEYGWESIPLEGDTWSNSLLVNGYIDFFNNSPITPFVTAGVGGAYVELNDFKVPGEWGPGYDADDTVFAWQVGAGIGYALTPQLTFDLKYRYFATSDPEFDGTEVEYASHNIYAGIRLNF